jgi:hypothetical protein
VQAFLDTAIWLAIRFGFGVGIMLISLGAATLFGLVVNHDDGFTPIRDEDETPPPPRVSPFAHPRDEREPAPAPTEPRRAAGEVYRG